MNIILLYLSNLENKSHAVDFAEHYATRPLYDWALKATLSALPNLQFSVYTNSQSLSELLAKEPAFVEQRFELFVQPQLHEGDELELLFAQLTVQDSLLVIDGAYPLLTPELLAQFGETFEDDPSVPLVTADDSYGQALEVPLLRAFPSQLQQQTEPPSLFVCDQTSFFSPANLAEKELIEFALRRYGFKPQAQQKIQLLVLDSDGVLNDAGFYYDQDSEVMKKFNTRDGAGIKQLQALGVEVRIITGERSGFTPARAKKLAIETVEIGCSDKYPVLDRWRQDLGLDWNDVAYMGDDLPDLPCIEAAGIGACPANAEPELKDLADYVAPSLGGHGCVRDLIRYMIFNGLV